MNLEAAVRIVVMTTGTLLDRGRMVGAQVVAEEAEEVHRLGVGPDGVTETLRGADMRATLIACSCSVGAPPRAVAGGSYSVEPPVGSGLLIEKWSFSSISQTSFRL